MDVDDYAAFAVAPQPHAQPDAHQEGLAVEARRRARDERAEAARRRARSLPGLLALVAVGFFAVLHGVAVGAASRGDYETATVLAWTVIVGTAATLLLSAAALVLDRGRVLAATAGVLSLLANPLVLSGIFRAFGA